MIGPSIYLQFTVIGPSIPAVDGDWSLLAELLLGLVDLSDEVDESLPGLGYALLRPVREVELADCPGLAVSCICHLNNNSFNLSVPIYGYNTELAAHSFPYTFQSPSKDIILNWNLSHICAHLCVYYTGLAAYSCPFTYRCPPMDIIMDLQQSCPQLNYWHRQKCVLNIFAEEKNHLFTFLPRKSPYKFFCCAKMRCPNLSVPPPFQQPPPPTSPHLFSGR